MSRLKSLKQRMREKGMSKICVSYNLRRATRLVTRIYDEALSSTGLRNTQFALLAVIQTHKPISVQSLAEAIGMDRTTLTRNLKPLERDYLIQVTTGKDRRVKEITMTKKGRQLLERATPKWEEAQARVEESLGLERAESLVTELDEIVAVLREE